MAQTNRTVYDSKPAIPNKLLQADGSITDLAGNVVANASPVYESKPALPDKWLNPDGSYSTLSEILAGIIDVDLFVIVDELPETGEPNKIYLLVQDDKLIEYAWVNNAWDPIGMIEFDINNYYTKSEVTQLIAVSLNEAKTYADNNFLKKDNTIEYTPTGDYNPATKKYIDDITTEIEDTVEGLVDNQISNPANGTSIDLQDSANSEVKSIDIFGNSAQKTTTGAQLIDLTNKVNTTINGIDFVIDSKNGTITMNGTATQLTIFHIPLKNAITTDTVVSICNNNTTVNSNILTRLVTNIGEQLIACYCTNINDKTENQTLRNDAVEFQVRIPQDEILTNFIIKPMLNLGSSVLPWEPCTNGASPNTSYPQEIYSAGDNGSITEKITNKNFYNKNQAYSRGKRLDIETGELANASGTAWCVTEYIKVTNNNKFTLSGKIVPNNWSLRICGYNKDKQFLEGLNYNYAQEKQVVNFEEKVDYIKFGFYNLNNIDFQLELGENATTYLEHQEQLYTIPCQQPMRAIGDVKDRFIKVNGVWYERHIIEKGVLGTENYRVATCWEAPDKTTADSFNTAYFGIIIPYTALNTTFLSNRFIYTGENYWDTDKEGLQLTMTDNRFRMRIEKNKLDGYDNDLTNTQKCRLLSDYLNNNLTEVLYSRVEPLDLPCTQAQITALEALQKARTYKNITHIYSEDEVPAEVDLIYYLDNETAYKNVLTKNNTTAYTPTNNYNPATKKYVDDAIANSVTAVLGGEY